MNIIKSIAVVLILSAVSGSGFYAGRKTSPRVMVMDPKTGQMVPLSAPNGATMYVASPDGFEVGAYVGHSKDGKKILILPPSMIPGMSQPDEPAQPAQPQSHHEMPAPTDLKRS
jgi:hypothetical protein